MLYIHVRSFSYTKDVVTQIKGEDKFAQKGFMESTEVTV